MSAATVLQAVSLTIDLLTVATRAMAQAQQISALVLRAQTEGRDTLTDDEWAQVREIGRASCRERVSSPV